MLYKKRCFDQKNVEKRIRAGRGLPFFHAQEANQAKSIRDGNPEQTEQTSKSVCLPAVAANCSLRLATRCHSKDSNAKLNQSNLTPGWPNTWGTRAQCLCPQTWLNALWTTLCQHCGYWSHMWKKNNISQNLLAPEWRTLFEECQFFHPDPKTPSQNITNFHAPGIPTLISYSW